LTPVIADTKVEKQRELFRQAEQALEENQQESFTKLIEQLKDYPVVAYLGYDAFKKRLSTVDETEVKDFIDAHWDYPFIYHLRSKWLNILVKRGAWQDYLDFYDDRNETRFKCLALTAKLKTGKTKNIAEQIRPIWLSGYSQPDECDEPFQYFLSAIDNPDEVIWLRIEKAFEARRPALAGYLAKKLDEKDQAVVKIWDQAHRHPQKTLDRIGSISDSEINRKIILHAVDRLARRDSLLSLEYWNRIRSEFHFENEQVLKIDQRIALSSAFQHKARAKELLEKLSDDMKTDNVYLWLARIYLRDEDWIGLVRTINTMPGHLKKEAEWVYWLARAYQKSGHEVKAQDIYQKLSRRSTYYGFLAADRSGNEYHIDNQRINRQIPFQEQQLLAKSIHLLRARELFFLNRQLEARREWFQGIRKLNKEEIKQAASMASSWKWHDNAIKTVAKTGFQKDYDLRFPMPYRDLVMDEVDKHQLDLSVIYGVIRRESLFDPLAKSRVGALGLMQLMPYTARRVAKKLGLKRPAQNDILEVDNNIRLGTEYFKTVLDQFDENIPLAAAAYNAGPRNVTKWLPEQEPLSADLWVETVPFKETRNYVQAILAYSTIFDKHLGKDVRISSRMQDVRSGY
jgi:soluble lytic murein transglycosylase